MQRILPFTGNLFMMLKVQIKVAFLNREQVTTISQICITTVTDTNLKNKYKRAVSRTK